MTDASAWDRYAPIHQATADLRTDTALYAPGLPGEAELRLLGNLSGKRVLELGCGNAQASVAFAKQGALVTAIDHSAEQLVFARKLVEREEVKVDLHQGDLADLAFVRADTMDAAFSADAFGYVEDLDRVFRQVHRVLRTDAPLAFSLPHPASHLIADDPDSPLLVRRSYFDRTPVTIERSGVPFTIYPRSIGELFSALTRAHFLVDTILEPEPSGPRGRDAAHMVPRMLIVRGRKLGT